MITTWMSGLVRARWQMLVAAASGVTIAVALLAVLGLYVSHSASTMTARAVLSVAPDWQVQLVGTSDASAAEGAIHEVAASARLQTVDYADVKSLVATTGGTEQVTGVGKAVGIDASYRAAFPKQLRLLAGSFDGPLLAQQTAANLHAGPRRSGND